MRWPVSSFVIVIGLVTSLSNTAMAEGPTMTVDSSAGPVLADEAGRTLYTFDHDVAGKPSCYGDCAATWPPFEPAKKAKKYDEWVVVKRTDGKRQWSYEGKPLYFFAKDAKKGDALGEGVGGIWHAAKP